MRPNTKDLQKWGILREYEQALRYGAAAHARSIRTANPDMKDDFDKLDQVEQ